MDHDKASQSGALYDVLAVEFGYHLAVLLGLTAAAFKPRHAHGMRTANVGIGGGEVMEVATETYRHIYRANLLSCTTRTAFLPSSDAPVAKGRLVATSCYAQGGAAGLPRR